MNRKENIPIHFPAGRICKLTAAVCICGLLALGNQTEAKASQFGPEVVTTSSYIVKIEAPQVTVHTSADESSSTEVNVRQGETFQVLSSADRGWVKIEAKGDTGYIQVGGGNATLVERTRETVDESVKARRETVEYALQFVGGRYVYGGSDPNTGADCSGFTRYVMAHAASVSLPHSSRGQAAQGREVPLDQMQPGDLLFYSNGSRINHVAMYIGNGQVVHASTEKTGIKTSQWNYRKPVKAVSLL